MKDGKLTGVRKQEEKTLLLNVKKIPGIQKWIFSEKLMSSSWRTAIYSSANLQLLSPKKGKEEENQISLSEFYS